MALSERPVSSKRLPEGIPESLDWCVAPETLPKSREEKKFLSPVTFKVLPCGGLPEDVHPVDTFPSLEFGDFLSWQSSSAGSPKLWEREDDSVRTAVR